MRQFQIAVSAEIDAKPEDVYAVLSDYRSGHPAILPPAYFTELAVEEGGKGAGTLIRVRMKALGVESAYRMVVSEPEPGRVLVEADDEAGVTTTFTVEPLGTGSQCRVRISTDMRASGGAMGILERLFTPLMARRIFRKQLRRLDEYMRTRPSTLDP